jgi:type VI secretion system protein VasJ
MNQPIMAQVELLLKPVDGFSLPQGEDIRYEPEFEQVEGEIAKLTSMHKDQKTDWKLVESLSHQLVSTRSKDIRLVCWYLAAVRKNQGLVTLPFIFTLLSRFLQSYWSQCYPGKIKIKLAALSWLLTQLDADFIPYAEQADDESQQAMISLLDATDALCAELLGEDAPHLAPKRQQIADVRRRQSMDKPAISQPVAELGSSLVSSIPLAATSQVPPSLVTLSSIGSDADVQRMIRGVQDQSRLLIQHFLNKDIADPRAYVLVRACAWLQIAGVPVADANGMTRLKPLTANKLQDYQQRRQAKEYSQLLPELEISITKAPFWLDGHFWSAEALDALGFPFLAAQIKTILQAFLQKYPNLLQYTFDDGSAFASDETKQWLESTPVSASVDIPATIPNLSTEEQPWTIALKNAEEAVRQSTTALKSQMQLLQNAASTAPSRREQCMWLLALVALCQQQQRHDIALAVLEQLADMVERFQLVDWEPSLAKQILQRWVQSLEKSGAKQYQEKITAIKTTLYRMDISIAF